MLNNNNNNPRSSLQQCPVHGDPMRLLCTDDGEYLCGMCFFEGKHRGHNVRKADVDVAPQMLVLGRFATSSAAEHEAFLSELSEEVKSDIEALGSDCSSTKSAISASFQKAHEELNARESRLLNKLEVRVQKYEDSMNEIMGLIEATKEEVVSLRAAIEGERDGRDPSTVLGLAQRVQAVEKNLTRIRCTRVLSARTAFRDDDVHFDEFPVAGLSFSAKAAAGENPHTLAVSWRQPNAVVPDEYLLEYREATGERDPQPFSPGYSGKACRCTLGGLKEDTEYELRICAVVGGERTELGGEMFRGRTSSFWYDSYGHMCNSEGDVVHFGSGSGEGRLYCGKKKDQCKCGNCDGRCGPTNGCPCDSCEALEKKVFSSLKCPNGHSLAVRRAPFRCNECGSTYRRPWVPSHHCGNCNYNLCPKCAHMKLPEEQRSKIIPNP